MGTNARMAIIGDRRPTAATTKPSVAAMLYAGATEAVAITVLDISPSAPDLRPFSSGCSVGATASLAVAMLTLPSGHPAYRNRITCLSRRYAAAGLEIMRTHAHVMRDPRPTVLA